MTEPVNDLLDELLGGTDPADLEGWIRTSLHQAGAPASRERAPVGWEQHLLRPASPQGGRTGAASRLRHLRHASLPRGDAHPADQGGHAAPSSPGCSGSTPLRWWDASLLPAVEEEVAARPGSAIRVDEHGAATVVAAGYTFAAGRFTTPTIAELREAAGPASRAAAGQRPGIRLSVLEGRGLVTDVGALQAFASSGTVFQVASQFNCLEAPGPTVVPVSRYLADPTQGPRAAVSAFPGALLRHYAAPDGRGGRFVQGDARSLNLLADALPARLGVPRSGYLRRGDLTDPRAAGEALSRSLERIRVGVHTGVEVVLGADWRGAVPPGTRVSQVLTSTLAGGAYGGAAEPVTQPLLRAAYLGTLLAAAALGRRRVVLTLIGGGVFGGSHASILQALAWAVAEAERVGVGAAPGGSGPARGGPAGSEAAPSRVRAAAGRAGVAPGAGQTSGSDPMTVPLEVVLNARSLGPDVDRPALAALVDQHAGTWVRV